ncbi:MAG: 50S ribosomal protein L11 methyltransferase [Gammaproteobacteria bacterium]|nr:50S ribosomal protein L11 methyltransferase [Gammaproteobacteria bacterium]
MNNYRLKHETITVNEIDYLIRSLKNSQQFYDHEQRAADLGISSATWSLFGVVWPASRILAATVCLFELDGKRVLEIGCGLALSSIVLHKMGVDITASDYHPLAKEFLDKNILSNDMSPIKFQTGNWQTSNPQLGEFDLIIGSDILYEPAHAEDVSQFIDCHSGANVEVLIVDPNRSNRANFTKKMIALGYAHHFENFNEPGTDDVRCKGRILHYQR